MEFFRFLKRESDSFGPKLLFMMSFSGLMSGLLIKVIVDVAGEVEPGEVNMIGIAKFLLCTGAFLWARRYTLVETQVIVEEVIQKIRLRIAEKVRKADYAEFQKLGSARLLGPLTTDTATISQAASLITSSSSNAVMLVVAGFFVWSLSTKAFFIVVGVLVTGAFAYNLMRQRSMGELEEASHKETEFFGALDDLLSGFKELKINSRRDAEFFDDGLVKLSQDTLELKVRTGKRFSIAGVAAQGVFYSVLGILLFILPNFSDADAAVVLPVTAVVLFIIGPLGEVIAIMPFHSKAIVAIENIATLERELEQTISDREQAGTPIVPVSAFEEINLEGVQFAYPQVESNGPGFQIGPMDFKLKAGEIVFIVGGNGSGKSTFLNLVCGLYAPQRGHVRLNNRPIHDASRQKYRDLFSPIFSDFHLFSRLFGYGALDPDKVAELLERTELADKTRIEADRITNPQLSTGQRKRLALVLSLLEDKPIHLFDEWAADQDPGFRKLFYEVLLPELKAQGKAVIAATHDDHYFHCADRVLKMEYGNFLPGEHHHHFSS